MEEGIRMNVEGSMSGVKVFANTPMRVTGLAEEVIGKCLRNQCPHLMVWSPIELDHKAAVFACGKNSIVRTLTQDNVCQCQIESKITFSGVRSG